MTKGFLPASGLTSASSVNIFGDGAAISQGQIRTSSEPDRRLKDKLGRRDLLVARCMSFARGNFTAAPTNGCFNKGFINSLYK